MECRVFKGASLIRFITFRELTTLPLAKEVIGVDVFGEFPETEYAIDRETRRRYVEAAGKRGFTVNQLETVLDHKGLNDHVELVEGDIDETVPRYLAENPELRIALLHVDVDIYEPSVTVMDSLFPRVVENGIVIFDDYGDFDGESTAVEEHTGDEFELRSMPYGVRGAYLVK